MSDMKDQLKRANNQLAALSTRMSELEGRERERNGHVARLVRESQEQKAYTNDLAAEIGRIEDETEVTALVTKTKRGVWMSQVKFLNEAVRLITTGGLLAFVIWILREIGVL